MTRVCARCDLPCYRRWPKSPAISSSAAWPLYLQQGKWWSKSSATDAWLRVARPNMPSGQSEEYHIVTVQSDQARVGFSSSGKHIRFKARGAAVAGGRGRRRTSGMARLHESTRKTSTSTSLHLPAASAEGEDGEGEVGWSSGRRCRSAGGCVCGEVCVCVCVLAGSSHDFVSSYGSELLRDCEISPEQAQVRHVCGVCVHGMHALRSK